MISPADWTVAVPVSDVALNYAAGLLSGLLWAKPLRRLWDTPRAALVDGAASLGVLVLVLACAAVSWALLLGLVLT